MKEIGGYFGLEMSGGTEFYSSLIALNTARNALQYLIRARNIRKLYLPFFLCDAISDMRNRDGFSYDYYHIKADFTPDFYKGFESGECLYIVNYYGQLKDYTVREWKSKCPDLILDNTHAFYQRPLSDVDTIYSCRKFFGVPDGAYLSTDCTLGEPLEQDISLKRMKHILGRFEGQASEFYSDFKTTDELFHGMPLRSMSKLTHNLLSGIDYEKCCKQRQENFKYLHERLKDSNKLELSEPIGPFCYPYYHENGMMIKKQLADMKIYIPTLWQDVLENCNISKMEREYVENILPIPCDQRYGIEDMEIVLNSLNCVGNCYEG